eukprot:jgi/Orpsp1_1/1191005/evm.model.d7180000082835.1
MKLTILVLLFLLLFFNWKEGIYAKKNKNNYDDENSKKTEIGIGHNIKNKNEKNKFETFLYFNYIFPDKQLKTPSAYETDLNYRNQPRNDIKITLTNIIFYNDTLRENDIPKTKKKPTNLNLLDSNSKLLYSNWIWDKQVLNHIFLVNQTNTLTEFQKKTNSIN